MAIDSLLKSVPPIDQSPARSAADWQQVEAALGTPLPSDYKQIIDHYPGMRWADFAYLLDPFSSNKYTNLLERSTIILDGERTSRQKFPEHYPLPLFPEPGGLLPAFITDNGDTGFWITQAAPDYWPMLIKDARAPECEVHFTSIATVLYRIVNRIEWSRIITVLPNDEDA